MKFIDNIKAVLTQDAVVENDSDRGGLVETIMITAGFAIASIITVNWFSTAITNKAADIAQCIEGSNTYNSQESAEICEGANHSAGENSFTKDEAYKGRFS